MPPLFLCHLYLSLSSSLSISLYPFPCSWITTTGFPGISIPRLPNIVVSCPGHYQIGLSSCNSRQPMLCYTCTFNAIGSPHHHHHCTGHTAIPMKSLFDIETGHIHPPTSPPSTYQIPPRIRIWQEDEEEDATDGPRTRPDYGRPVECNNVHP